jgi:tRNA dimethylallyltransferase
MNNKEHQKPSVLFIVGPTAVGKTLVAIEVAKMLKGEIISADSRQIYRGITIGTAKPTLNQQREIQHHLVDTIDLTEDFNAGEYAKTAQEIIGEIMSRGRIPIVVGGSGLYIRALTGGIFQGQTRSEAVRKRFNREADKKGLASLWKQLHHVEPEYAIKIGPNDRKRIIRALEMMEVTGKPLKELFQRSGLKLQYPYIMIGLRMDREDLYHQIEVRVDKMIQSGLIEEAKEILAAGYSPELNSLKTLGYQEVFQYLEGKMTREELVTKIKQNTRRYAKRQMTWFRKHNPDLWIDVTPSDSPVDIARVIVEKSGHRKPAEIIKRT